MMVQKIQPISAFLLGCFPAYLLDKVLALQIA